MGQPRGPAWEQETTVAKLDLRQVLVEPNNLGIL